MFSPSWALIIPSSLPPSVIDWLVTVIKSLTFLPCFCAWASFNATLERGSIERGAVASVGVV